MLSLEKMIWFVSDVLYQNSWYIYFGMYKWKQNILWLN